MLAGCGRASDSSADETAPAAAEAPEAPAVALASLKPDVAAGEAAFRQCASCHSVEAGKNGIGPSLHGIVGLKAGSVANYNYSPANKASGKTWDRETLYAYLENPREMIPGTKMAFGGIPDAQKRADLIAYLETLR